MSHTSLCMRGGCGGRAGSKRAGLHLPARLSMAEHGGSSTVGPRWEREAVGRSDGDEP